MGQSCDKPCCSGGRRATEEELDLIARFLEKHSSPQTIVKAPRLLSAMDSDKRKMCEEASKRLHDFARGDKHEN